MWVPESAEQIEEAARSGELTETATFDAKAEIGNAKEVSKDIAAMANDGGVLLYGVGEDENDRPTILLQVDLEGAKEKIANWAQTCIAPPPEIRPRPLPKADNPSIGYLVVEVPASPEAPHMVVKSQNNRFYGRNGPRNVRLGAGEVERLFRRREMWQRNAEELLHECISNAPPESDPDRPSMHLVASPLGSDDYLLERALSDNDPDGEVALKELCWRVQRTNLPFDDALPHHITWERRSDRYVAHLHARPESDRDHQETIDLQIYFDGSAYLFDGEFAAETKGTAYLREKAIVARTASLLYLVALICEGAGNFGPVDLAIKLTGIGGCYSNYLCQSRGPPPDHIRDNEYVETIRAYPVEMKRDPLGETHDLIGRFIDYTTSGHSRRVFDSS